MISDGAASSSGEEVICLFFSLVVVTVVPKKMDRQPYLSRYVRSVYTYFVSRLLFINENRITMQKKMSCGIRVNTK